MLEFTKPVEYFGRKFDRAMTLFEFDAFREPERTTFPRIGEWLREKGIEFNEVPTPQMLWRGKFWPDLFIANQLEAVPEGWVGSDVLFHPATRAKHEWPAKASLSVICGAWHGTMFNEAFIEPMCRKISGKGLDEIFAKYHRSLWLPVYWPATLRARQSLRTPFYYPRAGYAGAVGERLGAISPLGRVPRAVQGANLCDRVDVSLAYVIARPRHHFSVMFVVDDSPIYRVTDQDVCAGLDPENHRLIVEYRGECLVAQELNRLGLTYHPRQMAFDSLKLELPTIANVAAGWKPRPHINDQLLEAMNAEAIA